MLAELAAANAAFAVIKQTVMNGKELTNAVKSVGDFVAAKEELERRKLKKTRRGHQAADLEEFMALEKIREQEEQLKQIMIYTGRPGLWSDWQRFLAEARKSRRVQEELRKKRRAEIIELISAGILILALLTAVGGFAAWVYYLKT
jgi:hypothetical protein